MNDRLFTQLRAAAWLVALAIVCAVGWRDSALVVLDAWRRPEAAMCAGVPSFESVASTLPRGEVVIFVGVEPEATLGGEDVEFYRRFFCVQYALAPVVVRPAFTSSLLSNERARTADAFVVDARSAGAETLRALEALASRRGRSIQTQPLGADVIVVTMVRPALPVEGGEGWGQGAYDR